VENISISFRFGLSLDNEIITEQSRDAMLRVFSPAGFHFNNLSY